jgi:hypothetical protein
MFTPQQLIAALQKISVKTELCNLQVRSSAEGFELTGTTEGGLAFRIPVPRERKADERLRRHLK